MPKEIIHLRQFHGGINDASESTDISDEECQIADSCDLSSIGKLTLSGDLKGTDSAPPGEASNTQPGSGLFAFRSDRDNDGDNVSCNYYATHHANVVSVYDTNEDDWLAITANGSGAGQWSQAGNVDVEFLFQDGVLRSSDAQLHTGNQRKWWGYINRKHFVGPSGDLTATNSYSAMTNKDADLAAPSAGTCHLSADQGHNTGVMHFEANITGTDGEIPAANYRLAYSFIYDHHQESLLKEFSGSPLTISATQSFEAPAFTFHTLDARIVGCRVYIQRDDTTDDWTLLVDIDLNKGYRLGLTDPYTNTFSGSVDNEVDLPLTGDKITKLGPETYTTINGYSPDEPIDCSYKTAVSVKGITYAGNVLQDGVKYPDRMIKCAVVRQGIAHDVFPQSNFIDVVPNDGDEIVKLETFQDKVLVFKRKTLFVVNFNDDIGDYIDSTHTFMGIKHKGHSFSTAHGVVFMNDLGVHIYNGESVMTLTGKMQDLDIPTFTTTAGADDIPNADVPGQDQDIEQDQEGGE